MSQQEHPGWTGTSTLTGQELLAGGASIPAAAVEEAAAQAMQAWADDPQCRWWLPGETVDVSVEDSLDFNSAGAVVVKVHIPARFYKWLAPKDAAP